MSSVLTTPMTDEQREEAISRARQALESAWMAYEASNCLTDRATADLRRMEMEALVRSRSPEQVAKLEAARGLV